MTEKTDAAFAIAMGGVVFLVATLGAFGVLATEPYGVVMQFVIAAILLVIGWRKRRRAGG